MNQNPCKYGQHARPPTPVLSECYNNPRHTAVRCLTCGWVYCIECDKRAANLPKTRTDKLMRDARIAKEDRDEKDSLPSNS
jgi:hypothetical protein